MRYSNLDIHRNGNGNSAARPRDVASLLVFAKRVDGLGQGFLIMM